MSRDEFVMLVRDSGLVDRRLTGEVRELIEIYPYFQSAHLLLLKGLKNTSDIKLQNQLNISAIHIANREVLYHLLIDIDKEHSEESGSSGIKDTDVKPPAERAYSPIPVESIVQVLSLEDSPEQETSQAEEIPVITESVTEPLTESSLSVQDTSDLLEIDSHEEQTGDNEAEVPVTAVQKTDDSGEGKESKRQSQAELIDKFIQANPRIEPVRERSEAPVVDISVPFVEHSEGFVTETLARIYLNQHYYSRAIDIYEKLSLKFPEKSSYFAGQIEKIKALIK